MTNERNEQDCMISSHPSFSNIPLDCYVKARRMEIQVHGGCWNRNRIRSIFVSTIEFIYSFFFFFGFLTLVAEERGY